MKEYKTDQIRNVVLLGHGSSGKTSLAEAMLFRSGATNRMGKVGDAVKILLDIDKVLTCDELDQIHSLEEEEEE